MRIKLTSPTRQEFSHSRASVLVIITILVLVYRRTDQFLNPYIWVEDGTINLFRYADRGIRCTLSLPLAGFFEITPKLIAISAFKLSIFHAPLISLALTVCFTCAVVVAIGLAPTHLRAPFWCAIVSLMIPSGSENFAVGLYTFWWAGLLVILALLWKTECNPKWRIFALVVGGLSSPIMLILFPLFIIRVAFERTRREFVIAGGAMMLGALNAATYLSSPGSPAQRLALDNIPTAIGMFLGWFYTASFASPSSAIFYGLALIGALMLLGQKAKLDRYFILLAAIFLASAASTVLRVPIAAPHPFLAGPRYFFYPYITLGWMIIWIAHQTEGWRRMATVSLLIGAVGQGLTNPDFRFSHKPIDWKQQIKNCAQTDTASHIPIQYSGGPRSGIMWEIVLTKEHCESLIRRSIF